MASVLIVEDEPRTADILRLYLEQNGHVCAVSHDGHAGLGKALTEAYDVVLLDRMLPGVDGLQICQTVKSQRDLYVILLTAKAGEQDRVDGLEQGADDYIVKPFSLREVLARVNRLVAVRLPRYALPGDSDQVMRVGDSLLDVEAHILRRGREEVALTSTECLMLALLARKSGVVCSKSQLACAAELIDGDDEFDEAAAHKVTSHMSHVRRKLSEVDCSCLLRTVHSIGYRLQCLPSDLPE